VNKFRLRAAWPLAATAFLFGALRNVDVAGSGLHTGLAYLSARRGVCGWRGCVGGGNCIGRASNLHIAVNISSIPVFSLACKRGKSACE
jgi:hypothetical protein